MAEPLRLYTPDTLQNVISGLGTYKDKTIATNYVFVPLGIPQLEAAYRGDWIARKVVDIPAQDSTRMWREWQAEKDEITKIEDLERDLDIQGKVNKAMTLARLYGGSALILGVEGAGHEKEGLDIEKVKQDSLKFVHAVHRWEIGTNETDFDINSRNYRLPKYYTVKSGMGETLDIHWTRVIRFIGSPIPDPAQAPEGWGDSILQVVDTAIKGAGIVIGGIASLVQEAKIDVIKIPNLSERLSTKEYADKLSQRMTYANVIKSMNNALLIDASEEWQRIQTSFAALPDILQNYLICAAGAADIPATRLIGQSPRGLNATGESDTRNYYDKIKSEQNTILRPALSTLDEVLIRSALGSRDEGIFYEWRSLWQVTEAELADLAQKKAATYQIDVNAGLLDSNALRIGRENQLIEDGTYPGLEQTLQDQEDGKLPTEAEQFAHDPEMNPDHPQNLAAQQSAMAQAKEAEFHAKNPLAAIKAKAKPNGKGNPFQKKDASSPPGDALDALDEGPLDGGSGEEVKPTQAPPQPVIVNMLPPAGISQEEFQRGFDGLAQALGQSNAVLADIVRRAVGDAVAQVAKAQPHRGKVKRVVRDVEHDREGKITRIIDTEKDEGG
jgi:uncharacterized protein